MADLEVGDAVVVRDWPSTPPFVATVVNIDERTDTCEVLYQRQETVTRKSWTSMRGLTRHVPHAGDGPREGGVSKGKRYGAADGRAGYTLMEVGASFGDVMAGQLARDLILAQRECQRWAQWAADVSGADGRLSNDELMEQVALKVANAEREESEAVDGWNKATATIARVRALPAQWRDPMWVMSREGAAGELEATLTPPSERIVVVSDGTTPDTTGVVVWTDSSGGIRCKR